MTGLYPQTGLFLKRKGFDCKKTEKELFLPEEKAVTLNR
jgi:hypothetical protein